MSVWRFAPPACSLPAGLSGLVPFVDGCYVRQPHPLAQGMCHGPRIQQFAARCAGLVRRNAVLFKGQGYGCQLVKAQIGGRALEGVGGCAKLCGRTVDGGEQRIQRP